MCKGIFIWKLKKECLSQSISKSKFSNIISVDALFLDLKAMKIVFTTFLCHMNISVAKIAIKRNIQVSQIILVDQIYQNE